MSGSGKGLLGLWLYRSGEDWAIKQGSPLHKRHPTAVAETSSEDSERTSIIFSLKNQIGGLAKVLNVFQDLGVNVLHIESRKSEADNQVCPNTIESNFPLVTNKTWSVEHTHYIHLSININQFIRCRNFVFLFLMKSNRFFLFRMLNLYGISILLMYFNGRRQLRKWRKYWTQKIPAIRVSNVPYLWFSRLQILLARAFVHHFEETTHGVICQLMSWWYEIYRSNLLLDLLHENLLSKKFL